MPEQDRDTHAFEVIKPKQNEDFTTSPFFFSYERSGATLSGEPGLTGTVRFTLKKKKGPTSIQSVEFAIPFLDENDGLTKKQMFRSKIEEVNNTIVATVNLKNEWIRLAYGALSQSGFQKEPAYLHITYNLEEEYVVECYKWELPPGLKCPSPPEVSTTWVSHEEDLEVVYPCNIFGVFYRESIGDTTVTVGCRDVQKLGETNSHQYQIIEEADFKHDLYKVYRSLQQPEKFLILPTFYRIGRFDLNAGEQKAYRPSILFQSVIDVNIPANNSFRFHIMLTPDLPRYVRKELESKLLSLSTTPIIDYPSQLDSQYELKMGEMIMHASKVVESFHVTMDVNLANAILLRDMMTRFTSFGTVLFKLADSSIMESTLALELDNITGPWETGPIEVLIINGNAQLTNKIERPIEISTLRIYDTSNIRTEININIRLDSGEVHFVILPFIPNEIYPVYSFPAASPATLEELRSFAQDTHTTIQFFDLVNHQNHDIKLLEIKVRLKGTDKIYQVPMTGSPSKGLIDIIFPLTETYYQKNIIEFQVTKTHNSGEVLDTPWIEWHLSTKGNIISVNWDMIK
ncbi:hypothetical protein [Bacillus wiedmannii]|uniref:hypothetical protein n=2 Tax=Bacillus TaxID=1386 RepID=UPI000BFCC546|nr:hypothetical protein [Bacillus wiedmannii]